VWYVYRLPGQFTGWALATPIKVYYQRIMDRPMQEAKNTRLVKRIGLDLVTATWTAKQVGWNGEVLGEVHVITIPKFDGLTHGFAWKQPHLGTTFLASPMDMLYLHDDVDWDAFTDSEALTRAKNSLTGVEPATVRRTSWVTSKNGNQTMTHGLHRFTVFKNRRRVFGVVVSDAHDKKCFGKDCPTEQEAMNYADENVETLKKACK
jgi:hypothetical protein